MDVDGAIRERARRQHGVVGRQQLLAAGVPEYAIDNRVRNGRLQPLFRGVYRVGLIRAPREREMAAVLACGEGAVISHRSAAALYDLTPQRRHEPVEVAVLSRHPERGPGVRVYRVTRRDGDEATTRQRIPTTTPARTILDLASVLTSTTLERAVARAERNGLADASAVWALIQRYPRRAGTRALRSILGRPEGASLTRSEAEALFLVLVRRWGLPAPETNVIINGHEVDFLWRFARLVVEVDGYRFHSSPRMFEADRKRDRSLTNAGFTVMRVTLRELTEEPEPVRVEITKALIRGASGRGGA